MKSREIMAHSTTRWPRRGALIQNREENLIK